MAPKLSKPITVIPADLQPISDLLHLTFHRNKNQHRLAKWWGPFSQLRRHLSKLIMELENPLGTKAAGERIDFLRKELVPRCYLAFSAVMADNQYATLGLMLIGTLARLNRIIVSAKNDEDEEMMPQPVDADTSTSYVAAKEDLGEAIARDNLVEKDLPALSEEQASTKKQKKRERSKEMSVKSSSEGVALKTATPKTAKKKRKKGDAFDDLFSSLM